MSVNFSKVSSPRGAVPPLRGLGAAPFASAVGVATTRPSATKQIEEGGD